MAISVDPKDPNEILDYQVNWAARLGTDTIATSTFILVDGHVVIDSNTHTSQVATVWVSGGTLGEICVLTNRITTVGLRTLDQSIKFKVKSK